MRALLSYIVVVWRKGSRYVMFIVDNKNKMKPFFGGRLMAVFYFLLK